MPSPQRNAAELVGLPIETKRAEVKMVLFIVFRGGSIRWLNR